MTNRLFLNQPTIPHGKLAGKGIKIYVYTGMFFRHFYERDQFLFATLRLKNVPKGGCCFRKEFAAPEANSFI